LRLKWKHSRDVKRSQERPTFSLESRLDSLPLDVSRDSDARRARHTGRARRAKRGMTWWISPCARRTSTIHLNYPSKLACFTFLGMAPVVVQLRPSSEHIPIVRAPGARDHAGAVPARFIVRVLRAKRPAPPSPSSTSIP
jgi:hypothetical protein